MRADETPVALNVGADDLISSVGEGWNAFVTARTVASLTRATIADPFEAIVQSRAAGRLFEVMLQTARTGLTVDLDIWATNAERSSKVQLTVEPRGENGQIEVALRTLFDSARPPLALFDPHAARDSDQVDVCCFCLKVRGFRWTEPERALRQLGIAPDGPQPRIKHTVCDDCERRVYASCHTGPLLTFGLPRRFSG